MNISDFRNLFRDGQSPHCILQITAPLYILKVTAYYVYLS